MRQLTAGLWPSPLPLPLHVLPSSYKLSQPPLAKERHLGNPAPLVQLPEVLKFLLWHLGQVTDEGGRYFLCLAEKVLRILTQLVVGMGCGWGKVNIVEIWDEEALHSLLRKGASSMGLPASVAGRCRLARREMCGDRINCPH